MGRSSREDERPSHTRGSRRSPGAGKRARELTPPAVPGLLALLLARAAPLPAPAGPLPHAPAPLAAQLTDTTRALRAAGWDGEGAVPRSVTYLALRHQRILRL